MGHHHHYNIIEYRRVEFLYSNKQFIMVNLDIVAKTIYNRYEVRYYYNNTLFVDIRFDEKISRYL